MKTIEYRTNDRTEWGAGPWDVEPDKKQWQDQATGFPCLIVRNSRGALCGYVGVSESHPMFKRDYGDPSVSVHGGLTYADFCQDGANEAKSICHLTDDHKPVWWFGFDCMHAWDIAPGMRMGFRAGDEEYRDFRYVTEQVESLARQLAEMK